MLAEVGKPRAKVRVCRDPLLGGVGEALKWERISEIIDRYRGTIHLFLLVVDRDGIAGRRRSLDALESKAAEVLTVDKGFFGENARQEIEVWALAGQDLPKDWKWQEIRRETNPKETYFAPFVRERGLANEPGNGRRTLGREAAAHYSRVRSRCKRDVEALETRIRNWLG
jgi:hypothetical protein